MVNALFSKLQASTLKEKMTNTTFRLPLLTFQNLNMTLKIYLQLANLEAYSTVLSSTLITLILALHQKNKNFIQKVGKQRMLVMGSISDTVLQKENQPHFTHSSQKQLKGTTSNSSTFSILWTMSTILEYKKYSIQKSRPRISQLYTLCQSMQSLLELQLKISMVGQQLKSSSSTMINSDSRKFQT